MFVSTAIYPNRIEDKNRLDPFLSEEGNNDYNLLLPNKSIFATGYTRIVYGDHGPYIEFTRKQIISKLYSKFGNVINYNQLPDESYKYYYFWLYPEGFEHIKVYLQIKPVTHLPNAPKRADGKPSCFNRKEGYADYKRGFFYVDPYELINGVK